MTFCDSGALHNLIIGHASIFALGLIRPPAWFPEGPAGLLFDNHYLYWLAAAGAGLAAVYRGRTLNKPVVRNVGFLTLGLTALWVIAALLVATPAERLRSAHESILRAVERKDADAIVQWLHPQFSYAGLDRAGMRTLMQSTFHAVPIKSNTIRLLTIDHNGNEATTHLNVWTVLDTGDNHLTKWQIGWLDEPGQDWRVRTILPLEVDDTPVPADWRVPG